MADSLKQQSNPFSTGGGGPNFETRVQAAFTVLMLTGRVAPCLPPWPITQLKFQGLYAGFRTDDFIVYTKDSRSQNEAKLIAQVKHDIGITESNKTFGEVIQAAWKDFNDASVFNPGKDAVALITGPLSATDINNVRPLLEWARYSEDETEYLQKVNTAHFSSEAKRIKLSVFRAHLTIANGGIDVTDKQLWEFMKSFHLLGYDLDTESGHTLSLIQSLIALYSTVNPSLLWSRIIDAVQVANQNAGTLTLTLDTLPHEIRAAFSTRAGLCWDSDLIRLKEHGQYIIDGIRTSIGGVHVKRQDVFAKLLEAGEGSKFVLISGGRGCGKSSLVRQFYEQISDRAPVFCLRTEDLDRPHLDNVFSSIGLESSITDLEAGFALMPKKYLLIESVEKLLELKHSTAFVDLLNLLQKHSGWTVIATGRDYAYQQIVFNYLHPSGLNHTYLRVDDFDPAEIQRLCEALEPLKLVAENLSLRPLLKNPFIADFAYRVAEMGTRFSGIKGELEFRAAVWREIIAKERDRVDGMPLKRKQTFVEIAVTRARQMAYGVSEVAFDPETLLRLEEDDLIRRDSSTGLVSPAHDVLEDWALEVHIEEAYRRTFGDAVQFLDAVGSEPAMTRAYRLWLNQKLRNGDNVNELTLAILRNSEVQRYWQDETISAVLLGDSPYDFLRVLSSRLLENDGELLKRFCFVLRISCKTPDQELMKALSGGTPETSPGPGTLFLMPYGLGWNAVIRFLYEIRERVPESLLPHLTAVLDEWSSLTHLETDLPVPSREAGLLALHLLHLLKDEYRDDSGNREKLISVIIRTIPAIRSEFDDLLETDVFKTTDGTRRLSYVDEFCRKALQGINAAFFCRYSPDTVIKLAHHEWLIGQPSSNEPWRRSMRIGVNEYFGLREYMDGFFPPSGAKGPFQYLLRFHIRKGLNFILRLLDSAAETYAGSELDSPNRHPDGALKNKHKSARQINVRLNDGTVVKQYYSGRIWPAYRGHSVVPYLLQSALMALENWLINFVEHTESQVTLERTFDYILRNSNSVMPTAVLASVATGFPHKLGKAALPLLRTPELYSPDMARTLQERGGGEPNWFATAFQPDGLADFYADERRKAALRPWRKEHLETLITRLQFSDLREEAFTVIDELKSRAPKGDDWRFRFHRVDSRGWKPIADVENNRVTFEPQGLEPDLLAIQQKTQEEMAVTNRFSRMYVWSANTFDRQTPENVYFADWKEALAEARDLLELLKKGTAGQLAQMQQGGIVKAAAAFLRDHSGELSEKDAGWCAEVVIKAVMSAADDRDSLTADDKTDIDGAAAAASVIPIILDFANTDEERLLVKRVIAKALTHANATTRAGAANGIREHLWRRDPEFARRCLFGALEYARLVLEDFNQRRRARSLLDEHEQDSGSGLTPWVEDFRERLANGDVSLTVDDVSEIGPQSHSSWHILNPCLMIPNDSTEPHQVALLSRVLTLFFNAEESLRNHDRSEDPDLNLHYDQRFKFTDRFAEYLLGAPHSVKQLFIEQLREGCSTAPDFINYLLLSIGALTEKTHERELYWDFWRQISGKVQAIAIEATQRNARYRGQDDRRKLIRGLLKADAPWQKVDYENQDIALGKELILEFVSDAGKNPDVFEAMASLMHHFPKIFFKSGIHVLAKHQAEVGGIQLLSGLNTAFYLERSIGRFLQVDETGPLSRNMHESCFVLLNAVVETASSRAYYLREQLIRTRRII